MFRFVLPDVCLGSNNFDCTPNISNPQQRVKILFNKKDTALIQMAEPQQAMLAISHLDKCKLWGKVIMMMILCCL